MGRWTPGGATRVAEVQTMDDVAREVTRDTGAQISAFRVRRADWELMLDRLMPGAVRSARDSVTSLHGVGIDIVEDGK